MNFLDIFSKNTQNIKFGESPSSGGRVVPCGQTDGQTGRRTDGKTRKITVTFLNFAKANNATSVLLCSLEVSTMVNKKYGWNL
jgi:hypothetical protein